MAELFAMTLALLSFDAADGNVNAPRAPFPERHATIEDCRAAHGPDRLLHFEAGGGLWIRLACEKMPAAG